MLDYNKYKTGVDRSDHMLSHYSFERKTINWWKKLIFHLHDLVVVKAQIFHTKTPMKKKSFEIFYEKVAEGLPASASMEIQLQGQTSSPAGRLVGRENFLCRIPVTHTKMEGKCQHSRSVCRKKQAADSKN
jgi:hypothetical protein